MFYCSPDGHFLAYSSWSDYSTYHGKMKTTICSHHPVSLSCTLHVHFQFTCATFMASKVFTKLFPWNRRAITASASSPSLFQPTTAKFLAGECQESGGGAGCMFCLQNLRQQSPVQAILSTMFVLLCQGERRMHLCVRPREESKNSQSEKS